MHADDCKAALTIFVEVRAVETKAQVAAAL